MSSLILSNQRRTLQSEQSILLSDGFIPNIITIKRLSLFICRACSYAFACAFQLLDLPIARITLPNSQNIDLLSLIHSQ